MVDCRNCGVCCGIFSLFAIAFLCVVGAILKSGSEIIEIDETERMDAANNCFIGAAIYAGFFALSLACFFIPCGKRSSADSEGRQRLTAIRASEE